MERLKFFIFSGWETMEGEYKAKISGSAITKEQAYNEQETLCQHGHSSTTTAILQPEPGVYDIFNHKSTGGREVFGIVAAKNKRQAWFLLKQSEKCFNHTGPLPTIN